MNRLLTSIIMGFVAIAVMARTADIEISYTALSPNMKNGNVEVKNQYILLANGMESKFYSPMTEYIDSLNSTPEGKAIYQEMTQNAYLGGKMDEMPRKDGSYYITKSFPDKKLRYFDSVGLDKFVYEESPDKWNWTIMDSTKEILGYECVEATTNFHGRKWTVWFAPEIPVQNGPWKFDGLPGLILEAVSEGGQYRFEATGIQQTDKIITPVHLVDEYEKTTRLAFLKNKRLFLDNILSRLNAQLGNISITKVEDENGNDISGSIFASRKTVDFIETDY
ncbi:MAG: GLPGLI family protein [Muribaculaceae bacterium]|nr:GLPGLI family protein [Muribaculaceae bacterium]